MDSQKLQCPCGHSWERPTPGPVPTDIREICPVCTANIQAASTPAGGNRDRLGTEPALDLKPGDELAGFEIVRAINRGGMGVVYKARQLSLDRLVALKVIAPERLGDEDYLRRFRREVRAAALLNHPNIVTVYATDLNGRWPYLAMEYVDGIDLYRLVKHSGPLGYLESCAYIRQAALGLQHAFERGLVHRDVKPHNLMVTPSPFDPSAESGPRRAPVVKVLDMGLATVQTRDAALEEGLTQAGDFVGTPDYAAPEQAEDPRLADIRSDLYGLGATWFFLLTAEVPFPGVSLMQKLKRQLTEPTPLVTDHCPEIPPGLTVLVRKLMDRDPAQRFQTPAQLADAISAYMRDPSRANWAAAPGRDEPVVVPAHPGGVVALSQSADGKHLLTGGNDEALRLWETPELRQVRAVSGDPGPVCGVAMTGTGKWGASCALRLMPRDMAVQLWDLGDGLEKRRLWAPRKNLTCVALTHDGRKVAGGSEDGTVHVWTLDPPNKPSLALTGHTDTVTAVTFMGDGSALLSTGRDGTLRWWDTRTGRGQTVLEGDAGPLRALALARMGGRLAVAGDRLLLRQSGGALVALEGHQDGALCVAFSADGTLLASGGSDRTVRLWQTSDGQELSRFEGHDGPVRAVVFSPDGRFLYSGSVDGTLRRWTIPSTAFTAPQASQERKRPGSSSR